MEQPPNFFTILPTELSLNIIQRAAAASPNPITTLASIRRVSRAGANLATDLLVSESLKRCNARLARIGDALNAKWGENPSEPERVRLSNIFTNTSRLAEQFESLSKKISEKQASRSLFLKDAAKLPPATVDAVLKTMSFSSELQLLNELRKGIRNEEELLVHYREPNYNPLRDPLRDERYRPPPFYPQAPPRPFFPGAPDTDHLPPPDWERDRLPGGLPGMPWDPNPFNPFGGGGLGPQGAPNPFNPHGQYGRGPRYL